MPTQSEMTAISKAITDSGVKRIKKATKLAIAAFEAGEIHAYNVGEWAAKQKITKPELFEAKRSTNPWNPNFPADTKIASIASYIQRFGTASASRMAASCDVDLAGRPLNRKRA